MTAKNDGETTSVVSPYTNQPNHLINTKIKYSYHVNKYTARFFELYVKS